MQNIMEGLKSVPGVIGGMLSDEHGNMLAHSFPAFFDQSSLNVVASLISDNSLGIQDVVGDVKSFDIRTELGRIYIKSISNMFVTILCDPTANLQLLMISLNVACKKLEKLNDLKPISAPAVQAVQQIAPVKQAAPAPAAPAPVGNVRTNDKGVVLNARILGKTSNMSANCIINQQTAAALATFFHGMEYKSLHLYHTKNGKSVKSLVTISNDYDGSLDGVIAITPSLAGDLSAIEGDELTAVIITKKGFFD